MPDQVANLAVIAAVACERSFPRSAAGGIRLIVEDDRLEDMAISSKADIPIHEQMAEPGTPSNGFIRHLDQSGGVEKAARRSWPAATFHEGWQRLFTRI
ncbi:hypothetical protein [Shinella oryzae]|uniref:Uncharacterized protein n=1 Tax=Shinella oryzae TaxID=2871820 RepID=A0ABY9KDR9_9HYPH|nr:hypothetical protein [Shinella oryzae]WLS05117.1 hypothetical protein Q9315_23420 [Shinella oryzae]